SFQVLKELFGFSSKLLASDIIDKIYYNIYNLVIAKFFSARELGLYTRGQMFKNIVSESLTEVVGKVSFPVLASMQNEPNRLRANYKTILTSTQFIISIFMFVLAAIAEPLILTLIGEKWIGSVIYLQLLCFIGLLYPLHAISRNMMYVFGKSSLILKLQIFTKALAVPAILIGIFWGIIPMVLVMILTSIVEMMIKTGLAGKLVNYTLKQQLRDMSSSFFIALFIGAILVGINYYLSFSPIWILIIQLITAAALTILISEIAKNSEYKFIKQIAIEGLINVKIKMGKSN
ncbi:MAG: oligosaccharide flippase family protein, partial [Acholeplasma sp.]|nr:oligosaccharide flippase family protein [Acholeplasma sp.]